MFSALWVVLLSSFALLACDAAILDLIVIQGKRSACPNHYAKVEHAEGLNGDLNEGAGGDYIWLCVRQGIITEQNSGITDLRVIAKGNSQGSCSPLRRTWHRIKQMHGSNGDLNKGAGGKYIYLCYQKTRGVAPIVELKLVEGDCAAGMYRIRSEADSNGDLNQNGGGKYIYLCKKTGCIAKKVQGKWVPHGTIAAAVQETWEHGTSKKHSQSKTEDWSQSVSITVSQGWSLYGAGGSASVTGTFAHATSSTYSKEWSTSEKYTYKISWPKKYVGKTAWQFVFTPTDSCGHSEKTYVKEFAVTEGKYRPPCCVPGYAMDAPAYKKCKEKKVMVRKWKKYGCKAARKRA